MKRVTVTVPILNTRHSNILATVNLATMFLAVLLGLAPWWVWTVTQPTNAYLWLGIVRRAKYNGTPLTFTVPIPGTVAPKPIEPPARTPAAWPPKPGQCFICGCYDPQREETFGDATHPDCREWLGTWYAPPQTTGGITTLRDSYRVTMAYPPKTRTPAHDEWIYVAGRSSFRCPCPEHAVPQRPATTGFQYSWTCRCPVCTHHWSDLRMWSSGHPNPCHCSGCRKLRQAMTEPKKPHHSSCYCTTCHLTNTTSTDKENP